MYYWDENFVGGNLTGTSNKGITVSVALNYHDLHLLFILIQIVDVHRLRVIT